MVGNFIEGPLVSLANEETIVGELCEAWLEVCFRLKDVAYADLSKQEQIFVREMGVRAGNFLKRYSRPVKTVRPIYMRIA